MLELQVLAGLDLRRRGRLAAIEYQVGTEKFRGAQQHGVVQARAEITDGRAGGDCDQQGEEQHVQFARAGVT